jgi:hypothetical protein
MSPLLLCCGVLCPSHARWIVFCRVIPIPLPCTHPKRETHCFWRAPIRYETQLDLLRLLNLTMRHLLSCYMSVRAGAARAFEGPVILSLAVMAAIADVIVRTAACDVPSLFCLHMNGQGPPSFRFFLQPFGFDMGVFAEQSAFLKFCAPDLCTTRTRVLDYLWAQRQAVKDTNLIFDWERSLEPGNFVKCLGTRTAVGRRPTPQPPLLLTPARALYAVCRPTVLGRGVP